MEVGLLRIERDKGRVFCAEQEIQLTPTPVEPAIYAGQFTRPELQPQEFDGTDLEGRRTRQRQNSGRPHRSAVATNTFSLYMASAITFRNDWNPEQALVGCKSSQMICLFHQCIWLSSLRWLS